MMAGLWDIISKTQLQGNAVSQSQRNNNKKTPPISLFNGIFLKDT